LRLTSALAPRLLRVDGERPIELDSIPFEDHSISLASLTKNADGCGAPKMIVDRDASMLELSSRRLQYVRDGRSVCHGQR